MKAVVGNHSRPASPTRWAIEPAVVFVDLPSGSCLQASAHYLQTHENVAVVAGVNLAMLVDFLYHRDASPREAAERASATAQRTVRVLTR